MTPTPIALLLSALLLQPTPTPTPPQTKPTPASAPSTPAPDAKKDEPKKDEAKKDDKAPAAPTSPDGKPTLEITLDTSEAPDLAEWGENAKRTVAEWWPKLVEMLPSDGYKPQTKLLIIFKKEYNVPAAAAGDRIWVNAQHVRRHRDDMGMMVHELVHICQSYRRQKEDLGWLTEGIADYIRFWKYEPKTRQAQIDVKKASYRDAYRTTGAFLAFVEEKHGDTIVREMNARMRKGKGEAAMFKELTGKTVDELWKDFIDAGAPSQPDLEKLKQKKQDQKKEAPTPTPGPADPTHPAKK